jgi:hypothetical protein
MRGKNLSFNWFKTSIHSFLKKKKPLTSLNLKGNLVKFHLQNNKTHNFY